MDTILESVVQDIISITDLSEKLGESTKELYDLRKYMKNLEKDIPKNTIFANYGIVFYFANSLEKIAESGGHSELYRFISRVSKKYRDSLETAAKKLRVDCIREIFAENALNILNISTFRDNLKEYSTALRNTPETIDLYISIMQEVQIALDDYINTKPSNYKIIREAEFILHEIIDQEKNYFIGNTRIKYIKNMVPLNNFRFIPTSEPMSMSALIENTTKNKAGKPITIRELKNYALRNSYVFILLWHVSNSTVSYNLHNLFKKSINLSNKYGINEELIEKTNTIKQYENSKWKYGYDIIGDLDIKEYKDDYINRTLCSYYVYETIDGKLWRNLEPWPYPKKIGLSYYHVKNLLDYLIKGIDSRINNYHNASIRKSLPNMFLARQMPMENITLKSQEMVDNIIIIRELMYDMISLFNRLSINGKRIKKNEDMRKIINDPKVENTISNKLISIYKKNNMSIESNFSISEILVTYMNDLKKTTKSIIKEMNNHNDRTPLTIFLDMSVQKYYEEMIRISLEYVISSKANIYQNLQYKAFILDFGL
jgi:hypothetical protein